MTTRFERKVVDKVKGYLESTYADQVKVLGQRIGLWRFAELRNRLPHCFLSPDIDILLTDRISSQPPLIGAEVKAIYLGKGTRLNINFYDGLDEALALLRFGLDRVLLFQVFIVPLKNGMQANSMVKTFVYYPIPTREIIRTLNLPISYTPSLDFAIGDHLVPDPMQVIDLRDPKAFPSQNQLILRSRAKNPFLDSELSYPMAIRNFIIDRFLRKH